MSHLRYGRPVVIDDAGSSTQHGSVTKPVRKTNTRTEVSKCVVGDFSRRVDHNVSRQRAIAGNARSEAPHGARWRKFLDNICAVAEVNVSCFDSALLTYCGVRSVRRNESAIVAEAEIEGELGSGLPRVLDVQTHQAARASCLVHISAVGTIRNIEQEGTQRVTRLRVFGVALWVPSLPTRETKRSVGEGALELIGRETPAKRERVIAHDLREISADLVTVSGLRNVRDVLPTAGVAADSRTGNQRAASGRGESANERTGETNGRIQVRGWVREKGRRVVLVRSPRVLNLKHETGVESVHVAGAPISAGD